MTQAQAERHAAQAREKVDARREKLDGAAGWVAERAGEWDLDEFDPRFLELQKYFWNPLMDYYFRQEVDGWNHIPERNVLLVGIHSGAPFVWDAWTVGFQWWRHFGHDRVLHGTAHDALMAAPLIGAYFRKMGVLPAAPDSMATALADGRDVALWPGGEIDSLRPWTQRDRAVLGGRKGFVRMAIGAGVPILPVATVGGPDSKPILTSGRRIASALQLDRIARLKLFPIALQLPWGLSPAILPEIPLPTKIRTAFQEPIDPGDDPELANDDDYVDEIYDNVRQSIQDGIHTLARRRRLPVLT
jgi:1-acyl-sn-glycerol-3-phosphate acyltransferase